MWSRWKLVRVIPVELRWQLACERCCCSARKDEEKRRMYWRWNLKDQNQGENSLTHIFVLVTTGRRRGHVRLIRVRPTNEDEPCKHRGGGKNWSYPATSLLICPSKFQVLPKTNTLKTSTPLLGKSHRVWLYRMRKLIMGHLTWLESQD